MLLEQRISIDRKKWTLMPKLLGSNLAKVLKLLFLKNCSKMREAMLKENHPTHIFEKFHQVNRFRRDPKQKKKHIFPFQFFCPIKGSSAPSVTFVGNKEPPHRPIHSVINTSPKRYSPASGIQSSCFDTIIRSLLIQGARLGPNN